MGWDRTGRCGVGCGEARWMGRVGSGGRRGGVGGMGMGKGMEMGVMG